MIALRTRSIVVLTIASLAGLAMFVWPLILSGAPGQRPDPLSAPLIFFVLLPVVSLVVLAELADGGMDAKTLAMLGVLSAVNAALRPLGAGMAGIETVFFLLILAGRVFGPAFGFALGCTSLFASALLTGGVGPWLPFQMMCSAWIGLGAGLLPRRVTGKAEIVMLCVYGIVAAYAFGFLINLSFWPFVTVGSVPGTTAQLTFVAGDAVRANLHRFVYYTLLTSTAGWDTGRAIMNTLAIAVLGAPLLGMFRRVNRRANFGDTGQFSPIRHRQIDANPLGAQNSPYQPT